MKINLSVPVDDPAHPLHNTFEYLILNKQGNRNIADVIEDFIRIDKASWQLNVLEKQDDAAEFVDRQAQIFVSAIRGYIIPNLFSFVKTFPQDPQLHCVLGYAAQMVGKYSLALKEYLLAIEYSEKTTHIHFLFAQLCWTVANERYYGRRRKKDFRFYCDMAIRSVDRVLSVEQDNTEMLVLKGVILGACGVRKLKEGVKALSAACSIEPENFWNHWELANLCEKFGNIREAFFAYKKAKDVASDDPDLADMAEEKISFLKKSFKRKIGKNEGTWYSGKSKKKR